MLHAKPATGATEIYRGRTSVRKGEPRGALCLNLTRTQNLRARRPMCCSNIATLTWIYDSGHGEPAYSTDWVAGIGGSLGALSTRLPGSSGAPAWGLLTGAARRNAVVADETRIRNRG